MRILRRSLTLLAIVPIAAFSSLKARAADPPNVKVERDISYIADGDAAHKLDLYLPATPGERPQPLLIWIHGGGWRVGSKTECRFTDQVARGYVVASIDYRFSQKAKFPAQIQDCQAAVRWLRANAAKYHIDPEHVGVGGDSAGGHLVALLGTCGGRKLFPAVGGNEDQSDRVQAVCDLYGPTDFLAVVEQANADTTTKNIFKWNAGDPYSQLIDAKVGEDKASCEAVSPTHYVNKNNAPILILHGDHDTLVPYAQSVELAAALQLAGVPVTLQKLPGADHGGPAFHLPKVDRLIEKFLDKYLKGVDQTIEPLPDADVTPDRK